MSRLKRADKRKYPRIEAKIKVSFQSLEDLRIEYTRNISAGGIFLKTNQLLDPNAEIELTLHLPSNLGDVNIRGRVVRLMSMSHPDQPGVQLFGVGIRFIKMSAQISKKIEQAIESLPDNTQEAKD